MHNNHTVRIDDNLWRNASAVLEASDRTVTDLIDAALRNVLRLAAEGKQLSIPKKPRGNASSNSSREEILRQYAPPEPLLPGAARDGWLARYAAPGTQQAPVSPQEPPEPAPVQSPAPEAARPAQPFQGRRSFTPAEPVPVSPVEHFHDAGHWDETTGTFRPCGCDQYD